jgi:xanthine dehydrogenase molybdopterin-binding subunit B
VVCEAEVDIIIGEITIHKLVTVDDVGKAINPQQVEMQDAGAAIMGFGHRLMEHLLLDEHGWLRNAGRWIIAFQPSKICHTNYTAGWSRIRMNLHLSV